MIAIVANKFTEGGPFMWVILLVLAVACAVIIERTVFYFIICRINGAQLISTIARALNNNNISEAKNTVRSKRAPVQVLVAAAIERYEAGMGFEDIQEGVEQVSIKELPRMAQRLNYLSLFANIATLIGLLGTIAGLQVSFTSLVAVEASQKASMLAKGISQAMNTTAFGLIVAVPCMVFYTLLSNKKQALIKDLDETVVRLLNFMKKKVA